MNRFYVILNTKLEKYLAHADGGDGLMAIAYTELPQQGLQFSSLMVAVDYFDKREVHPSRRHEFVVQRVEAKFESETIYKF